MVSSVANAEDFKARIKDARTLVVVHFSAEWAPQSSQVRTVLDELSKMSDYAKFIFLQVDVDAAPAIVELYKVEVSPTIMFFLNGELQKRLSGCDPSELKKQLDSFVSTPAVAVSAPGDLSNERLKELINRHRVMLFMKGTPDAPRCGFSRQIVELIRQYTNDFGSFDILADEVVRQSLKKYSNWPTYPQLYVDGQLIGGLDIVREMKQSDEADLRQLLCGSSN